MNQPASTAEAVAALRAAADLIESLPFDNLWFLQVDTYNLTGEELGHVVRLPGTWEKDLSGGGAMFVVRQGIVELHADRDEVCTAVPTGNTVKVKKVVTPAVTEEVEVPEVRWECEPLLAETVAS